MSEVEAVADRFVVLAGGRRVASGTGPELLAQTAQATLDDAFPLLVGDA
jgi:ABC-type Na+ transport system ATPase subunit NatA